MAFNIDEVKAYREENNCSMQEAVNALTRQSLGDELESSDTIEDLKIVLRDILEFEFGENYCRRM